MRASLASLVIGACLLISVAPTLASPVIPVTVPGNPTCASVGPYSHEFKVEPVTDGLHADPASDFVVTLTTQSTALGATVDFTANLPIDAVLVKGGPNANLYAYLPSVLTDDGLHAPIHSTSSHYGLGHVRFCFTDVPSSTATPTPTPTPTPDSPTPTPDPTPTPTPDSPTPTPDPTPTPTPDSPTPTPDPTPTPTPDPTPTPTLTPVSAPQPPTSPTPDLPEPAEAEAQPSLPSSSEQPAEMASPVPTPTPPTTAGLAFPPAVPPAPPSDGGPTPPSNELMPADVVGGVLAAAIEQVASVVKPEAAAAVATAFSFPLILMLAVACFLVGQGRIDARDPKLRSAPRTREDTVLTFRKEEEL